MITKQIQVNLQNIWKRTHGDKWDSCNQNVSKGTQMMYQMVLARLSSSCCTSIRRAASSIVIYWWATRFAKYEPPTRCSSSFCASYKIWQVVFSCFLSFSFALLLTHFVPTYETISTNAYNGRSETTRYQMCKPQAIINELASIGKVITREVG